MKNSIGGTLVYLYIGNETNKNELMDTRKGSHNSITLGANKGFALVSGLKWSFVKNYTTMK